LIVVQEGACGPGTAACSNRLLLGFLGVLYEVVEFGFEGGGVGGDVSWFGTDAGVEGETLATAIRVAAAASGDGSGVGRCRWQRRRGSRPAAASASALRRLRAAAAAGDGGCGGVGVGRPRWREG
jgi:hypothetical protein